MCKKLQCNSTLILNYIKFGVVYLWGRQLHNDYRITSYRDVKSLLHKPLFCLLVLNIPNELLISRYDEDNIGAIDGSKLMKKLGITLADHKAASSTDNVEMPAMMAPRPMSKPTPARDRKLLKNF